LHSSNNLTWCILRLWSVASCWTWQLVCENTGIRIPAACSSPERCGDVDRGQYFSDFTAVCVHTV